MEGWGGGVSVEVEIVTLPSLQCQYDSAAESAKEVAKRKRCNVCNPQSTPKKQRKDLILLFIQLFWFSENGTCCYTEQNKSSPPAWLWVVLKIDISARAGSAQIVFNLCHLDGKKAAATGLLESKSGWCMCSAVTHWLTGHKCVKAKMMWADPARTLRPDTHSGKYLENHLGVLLQEV